MSGESKMHFYVNWAKERLDEMDAALASLEAKVPQVKADAKVKAEQAIADLKKRRDEFAALAEKEANAGEATWRQVKAGMEAQWDSFEGQLKAYLDTAGKHIEQQGATFLNVAAAQAKAWREAADTFRHEAGKIAAAKRTDLDAAINQMKADAGQAEARFNKLKQVGSESWAALSAALAESRKAFDRANQTAADALKGAGAGKAA
jgi:hypothetical protein